MGIDIKKPFPPRAPGAESVRDRASPRDPVLLKLQISQARMTLESARQQLANHQREGGKTGRGGDFLEIRLKGKVLEAADKLDRLETAFEKTTGRAYKKNAVPPHQEPSADGFSAGPKEPGASARRSPSPDPPKARGRSSTGGITPNAKPSEPPTLASGLGKLWGGGSYESRERTVRGLDLGELRALESDLPQQLRHNPPLRAALRDTLASASTFNRALFAVHPDKNRPQAERSAALSDPDPVKHTARIAAHLEKLDVARNILNAGMELSKQAGFAELFSEPSRSR